MQQAGKPQVSTADIDELGAQSSAWFAITCWRCESAMCGVVIEIIDGYVGPLLQSNESRMQCDQVGLSTIGRRLVCMCIVCIYVWPL